MGKKIAPARRKPQAWAEKQKMMWVNHAAKTVRPMSNALIASIIHNPFEIEVEGKGPKPLPVFCV